MDSELGATWMAFYVKEASDADPEVTKWDDDRSKKRKLDRMNARKKGR